MSRWRTIIGVERDWRLLRSEGAYHDASGGCARSDGRAFFRTDMVNMDVGRFSTDADGKYDNNWGTCTLEKCSGHRSRRYGRERGGRLAE